MQRSHSFRVKTTIVDNEYTMEIPTAGQLIEIERKKAVLAGGNYGDILSNRTRGSEYALDIIDMSAYLSVLCPELFADLKTNSLEDLDIFDMKQLKSVWENDCIPWINEWQQVLREAPQAPETNEPVKADKVTLETPNTEEATVEEDAVPGEAKE